MKNVWKIYMRSRWPQGLHIMELLKTFVQGKRCCESAQPFGRANWWGWGHRCRVLTHEWPQNTSAPTWSLQEKTLWAEGCVMFVGSMIGERRQHAQLSTIRLSSPGFLYLFVIISTLESKRLHSGEGLDGLLQSNLQIALCPCTSGAEWSIVSWACTNNFSKLVITTNDFLASLPRPRDNKDP